MTNSRSNKPHFQTGFSLIELAIALAVLGILLGGLMMPLSRQIELRNRADTLATLNEARDALLGFAAAHGRLPCPATAQSNGAESPVGGGLCTQPYDGFLPGATLGLAPTDAQGFVTDAWGTRIRYAVTPYKDGAFTTADGIKSSWPVLDPNLIVCATASGATQTGTANATCPTTQKLANGVPAILFSHGPNRDSQGGLDEQQNRLADPLFIHHEPTAAGSPNGEFDDLMVWLSPAILYNRMITAARLP